MHFLFIYARTTDTQRELFFKNSKLLGLGRQICLKFFEAFGVFSDKILALFWYCESLVHGKMQLVLFPAKTLVFRSKTYNSQMLQNKILVVKNLEKSLHTSIFGVYMYNHAIKICKEYAYLFLLPTGKSKVPKNLKYRGQS
jgi:hypothetical protein